MHITENQLKLITQTASQEAIKAYRDYKEKQDKEKHDRRLRNTKLLLKKYRSFVLHCEDVRLDIKKLEKPKEDLIEELEENEYAVESIKRSKERTLIMVEFIKEMLAVYRTLCEQSSKPEEQRRYDIINKMYISDQKYTAEEIATCHNIEVRTVYRDINKACNTLSGLVFGVDSVKFHK
ncbi:hypothetical protein [Virgibacillus salexigens]|uniref:hypothetical protein n=1 Tax=Virgibacillus TaxID=84406 RepID=UPI00136DE3C5|nr:hypothetical protein [Virgibacillus massiliensis]MYL41809.1 hypothetical protein [Virgibacillus massiliensis]